MTGTADGACRPCAGNSEALSVSLPISLPHHTTRGYGAAGLFTKPERSGTGRKRRSGVLSCGNRALPGVQVGSAYKRMKILPCRIVFQKLPALKIEIPAVQEKPPLLHRVLHPGEGKKIFQ